jgi:hypothetical protein
MANKLFFKENLVGFIESAYIVEFKLGGQKENDEVTAWKQSTASVLLPDPEEICVEITSLRISRIYTDFWPAVKVEYRPHTSVIIIFRVRVFVVFK